MTMVMMLRLRLSLVAVIALGLVVLGMSHHAPSQADEALAAYALAGGDLAALCDGDGLPDRARDCPACHITGTAGLPGFAGLAQPVAHPVLVALNVARDLGVTRPALDPGHGLRAPPAA